MSIWSTFILESGMLDLDTSFKSLLPNHVSNWLVQPLYLALELWNVVPKLYLCGIMCRILKGAKGERTVSVGANWTFRRRKEMLAIHGAGHHIFTAN